MSAPELHLYDQDHRWIAGGRILPDLTREEAIGRVAAYTASLPADPGEPAPSVAGYHDRQSSPGRCGRPAAYQWAGGTGIRPLPAADLLTPIGAVFATDARDRHLTGGAP